MTDNILKPGRYINGEWNSVHKEWKEGVLKVALCFPDIYEIGMSHLGMKILYGILNQEEDVVCDRIFAPWSDMEKKIRLGQAEFLSLESGRRLKEFDIIGFSLQYEMNFVDVLNMLDLGGVPIFSNQRSGHDSIVIAGGVGVFNPEVMADFIDVFVVGEAEEAILEIVSVVRSWMLDPGCW
ncbi:MAG: B12-binding domain-containing radical SAM protein, partial [Candidatus Omnitrophica bacterium]|nr:B12-binding domain-containing radical SAM protein [Candidatus Omnitrophota bacterium]